ncbi:MAG: hypothetical protein D6798_05575, partial [Deltaproteobacteria bacterium]
MAGYEKIPPLDEGHTVEPKDTPDKTARQGAPPRPGSLPPTADLTEELLDAPLPGNTAPPAPPLDPGALADRVEAAADTPATTLDRWVGPASVPDSMDATPATTVDREMFARRTAEAPALAVAREPAERPAPQPAAEQREPAPVAPSPAPAPAAAEPDAVPTAPAVADRPAPDLEDDDDLVVPPRRDNLVLFVIAGVLFLVVIAVGGYFALTGGSGSDGARTIGQK